MIDGMIARQHKVVRKHNNQNSTGGAFLPVMFLQAWVRSVPHVLSWRWSFVTCTLEWNSNSLIFHSRFCFISFFFPALQDLSTSLLLLFWLKILPLRFLYVFVRLADTMRPFTLWGPVCDVYSLQTLYCHGSLLNDRTSFVCLLSTVISLFSFFSFFYLNLSNVVKMWHGYTVIWSVRQQVVCMCNSTAICCLHTSAALPGMFCATKLIVIIVSLLFVRAPM